MICPNCKKEYEESALFCHECGAKLDCGEQAEPAEAEPASIVEDIPPVTAVEPVDLKPQPSKAGGCAAAFFSVFFCFLIFIFAIPAMLIGQVRSIASPVGLQNTISAIAPEDIIITNEKGREVDALEYLVDIAEEYGGEYVDIDEEDAKRFLEKSSVLPFVAEKVAEVVNGVVFEDGSVRITEEDVRKLLDENSRLLGEFGIDIDEEIQEEIIDTFYQEGIFDRLNTDLIMKDAEPVLSVVRAIFSYKTIGTLGFIILILALLIVAINRYDKLKALTYVGVTFIIVGLLFALPALAVWTLSDIWISLFSGAEIVGTIVSSAIRANIILPLSVLILGIILVAVRIIVRAACSKKAAEAKN